MVMSFTDFNKELGKILGNNPNGEPHLKLVNCRTERWYPDGPLKYLLYRKKNTTQIKINGLIQIVDTYDDITPECLAVEQWFSPAFFRDNKQWENKNKDERGNNFNIIDPSAISRGGYRTFWMLLDPVLNEPLPLDRGMLEYIKASAYTTVNTIKHGPEEEPTDKEVEEAVAEFLNRRAKFNEQASTDLHDMIKDAFSGVTAHRLTLANFTEGTQRHTNRGRNYDPGAWDRIRNERLKSQQSIITEPIPATPTSIVTL